MGRVLPILFNTEMVQAILRKAPFNKTATRRVAKHIIQFDDEGLYFNLFRKGEWTGPIIRDLVIEKYAPYRVGDTLYVRETWCNANKAGIEPDYYYLADTCICEDYDRTEWKWRPSIHMPKQAARIFLKVKDVRIERLQNMWASDVPKEGIHFTKPHTADEMIAKFAELWDSTIPKKKLNYRWEANPWVWVIEFEQCEKP